MYITLSMTGEFHMRGNIGQVTYAVQRWISLVYCAGVDESGIQCRGG